jgi:hypothetical protein
VRDTKLIEVIVGGRDMKIALRSGLRKDGRQWANQFVACGEWSAFVPGIDPEVRDTEPRLAVNDAAGNLEKARCGLRCFGLPTGLFCWFRWLCLLGFLWHGCTLDFLIPATAAVASPPQMFLCCFID